MYISAEVVNCDAMAWISLSQSIKQITLPDPLFSFDTSGEEKRRSRSEGHCDRTISAILFYKSYLVDSASSHMLVSKIKPCMSKYKQFIL